MTIRKTGTVLAGRRSRRSRPNENALLKKNRQARLKENGRTREGGGGTLWKSDGKVEGGVAHSLEIEK